MAVQHFLTLKDLSPAALQSLIERAAALKKKPAAARRQEGRTLALLFDKASTRTRMAFETAMVQTGGGCVFLSGADSQLGRGEPPEDSARVLSRMADCIAVRTFSHGTLQRFAAHSSVPVINALTDAFHPCQLLADMQTYAERRGPIRGRTVAWVGDGNNVCRSYINAAPLFGFHLRIATPPGHEPDKALPDGTALPSLAAPSAPADPPGPDADSAPAHITIGHDPAEAVTDADLVVTDVWASMGQEQEAAARAAVFAPYQVNNALMQQAADDALFMHCLPAHRGEEVTPEVLEGPQSAVWDQAENRLHTQKALLELLLP